MKPARRRVAALAATLSTLAIAVPTAGAATADDGSAFIVAGWESGPAAAVAGSTTGQLTAVLGPLIITAAPSTIVNVNNQVAAGPATAGVQSSAATTGTW
jgi:hypothetical protein